MNKKLAIITGASSGIGKTLAHSFQELGYQLFLLGRNLDRLQAVTNDLAGSSYFQCDFSDAGQITKACQQISEKIKAEKFDKIVLINNAGIVSRMPFTQNSLEQWQNQFQTNLFAPALFTQGLIPALKSSGQARILNISSTLAIRPIADTSIYSASKAALNSLTQALALELAPFKIPVNAICPGIIETPIHDFYQTNDLDLRQQINGAQPMGRIGQPDDIAKAAVFFGEQASEWITGTLMPVDGGILLNS